MDHVTTATIFVNASTRVEGSVIDFLRGTGFVTAHDHITPTFGRSHFIPVNVLPIEHRLA